MKLLLPAALLLSLASCSKNSEPAPVSAFSCQVDGKLLMPNAHVELVPAHAGYPDALDITTASANSPMSITVHYLKTPGSADTEYKLNGITYVDASAGNLYTRKLVGTLAKTSSGAWSGTFAGEGDAAPLSGGYSTLIPTVITQGVFTEVKP